MAVIAGSGPAHKHFWTSQASALLAAPSWATHSRQQLGSWGSLLAEPCSASLQAAAKRIHSHAHLAGRSMLSGHGRQPGQLSRQQQAFSQPAGRRSSNSSSSSSHNTARTSEQSTTKGAVAAVASKQSASAAVGLPAAAQPATPTLMTSVRSVLSPAEVYQQVAAVCPTEHVLGLSAELSILHILSMYSYLNLYSINGVLACRRSTWALPKQMEPLRPHS